MKSKEELNTLKEEFETLSQKFCELTDEELEQVTGGNTKYKWKQTEFDALTSFAYNIGEIDLMRKKSDMSE